MKISKIEYYLPQQVLTNEDLEKQFPEWSSERIQEKVGISQRHISSDNETVLDMAVQSSEKIFETYDRSKVDFVLFCTQSPEYFLPTTACILQDRLGLRKKTSGRLISILDVRGLYMDWLLRKVSFQQELHKVFFW